MSIIHPLIINNREIISNVFFAPINPGGISDGIISNKYIDFFVQHSGNGIGICYVGNVALQKSWTSNKNTAVVGKTSKRQWSDLVNQIEEQGSLPGIQLAWKPFEINMQRSFITENKEEQIKIYKEFYYRFKDFDEVADLFVENINIVKELGFQVIQLHAAHGYALSVLLSRTISGCKHPKDTKGIAVLDKIMKKLNTLNVIYDIRLSIYEGINDNLDELEYKTLLVEMLIEYGFQVISLSNGFYNINKTMIYPKKNEKTVILGEAINFAKKYPNIIWNVAGNMENALLGTGEYPENLSFSIGRQLLADPNTILKIMNDKCADIQLCTECNMCHYYSNGFDGIQVCK